MWTAIETSLSKNEHFNKPYNYFNNIHYYGYIGKTETMQELIDYIRNAEDSYKKLHLEETNESGAKYMLTIRSICYGYKVEFLLYDLNDLSGCDEIKREELEEVKTAIFSKKFLDNIGYVYGTCIENSDGSFDMTTFSGTKLHYNNASDGLADWLEYLEDTDADEHDNDRAELIHFIKTECVAER